MSLTVVRNLMTIGLGLAVNGSEVALRILESTTNNEESDLDVFILDDLESTLSQLWVAIINPECKGVGTLALEDQSSSRDLGRSLEANGFEWGELHQTNRSLLTRLMEAIEHDSQSPSEINIEVRQGNVSMSILRVPGDLDRVPSLRAGTDSLAAIDILLGQGDTEVDFALIPDVQVVVLDDTQISTTALAEDRIEVLVRIVGTKDDAVEGPFERHALSGAMIPTDGIKIDVLELIDDDVAGQREVVVVLGSGNELSTGQGAEAGAKQGQPRERAEHDGCTTRKIQSGDERNDKLVMMIEKCRCRDG